MEQEPWIHLESRESWRSWLVSWKARTGRPTVSYETAVEEALCFGWIDGRTGRVDGERTMVRFSPRRRGSVWARSNRERVARLEAAGLMTEAGRRAVEAAPADGSWTRLEAA